MALTLSFQTFSVHTCKQTSKQESKQAGRQASKQANRLAADVCQPPAGAHQAQLLQIREVMVSFGSCNQPPLATAIINLWQPQEEATPFAQRALQQPAAQGQARTTTSSAV